MVFIFILVALGAVVYAIYKIKHKIDYGWVESPKHAETKHRIEEIEKQTLTQITNLGNTPEEREKGINRLFDEKKQTIFFIDANTLPITIYDSKKQKIV